MEYEIEIVREFESYFYWTTWAIRLMCAQNGNVNGWIVTNDVACKCVTLPPGNAVQA